MELNKNKNQNGFTIIELLIATAVLSTILVMVTIMMTAIGRLYYKGINQARVQDNVRSITDEVSTQLQLSSVGFQRADDGLPMPKIRAICIGTTRYTYILNTQIGDAPTQSKHVLWRDTVASGCAVADLSQSIPAGGTNGAELIAPNSRLTSFDIPQNTSPYTISVGVLYGDDDLKTGSGSTTQCVGGAGGQFCAKANLKTTIGKRL